jgi:hypothetical protein
MRNETLEHERCGRRGSAHVLDQEDEGRAALAQVLHGLHLVATHDHALAHLLLHVAHAYKEKLSWLLALVLTTCSRSFSKS